jgi:hypothetical protein
VWRIRLKRLDTAPVNMRFATTLWTQVTQRRVSPLFVREERGVAGPTATDLDKYSVVFENERVRVLDV